MTIGELRDHLDNVLKEGWREHTPVVVCDIVDPPDAPRYRHVMQQSPPVTGDVDHAAVTLCLNGYWDPKEE